VSYELLGFSWQDIVFAIGGFVGLASKAYALSDSDTAWSRWASLPNAALFVPTVLAFYSLELYLATLTSSLSMLIWFGIGIWRTPDSDDSE